LKILGSFLGHRDWIARQLQSRAMSFDNELRLLDKIHDLPQEALLLLRACFNPRLFHLARTVDPMIFGPFGRTVDFHVNQAILRLLCCPAASADSLLEPSHFSNWPLSLRRARLQPTNGGLGIVSIEALADPAFSAATARALHTLDIGSGAVSWWLSASAVAAVQAYRRICDADSGFEGLPLDSFPSSVKDLFANRLNSLLASLNSHAVSQNSEHSDRSSLFALSAAHKSFQSRLTDLVLLRQAIQVSSSMLSDDSVGSSIRFARFLSLSSSHASYWHLVCPYIPEFRFEAVSFRSMLCYHLDLPLPISGLLPHVCECGGTIDNLGYHLIECQRIPVHDALVREIEKCVRAAGALPLVEPRNVLVSSSLDRPDLSIQFLDDSGKTLLVDVTTGAPTAPTYVSGAASRVGYTADTIERRKLREYRSRVDPSVAEFIPVGVEIPGRWGSGFSAFFRKVVLRAKSFLGSSDGSFAFLWRRRLACVLKKVSFSRAFSLARRMALSGSLLISSSSLSIDDLI
jgi:hypothetical protein